MPASRRKTRRRRRARAVKASENGEQPGLEEILAKDLEDHIGQAPVREYRFCKQRKFRFDLAYRDQKIAIEVDGRSHGQPKRMRSDAAKFNLSTMMGWKVLRYPASVVKVKKRRGLIVEQVNRLLHGVVEPELDAYTISDR